MQRNAFVLSLAAAASAPRFVEAQTVSVQDAIARLFTGSTLQPAWFDAPFLAAIPLARTRSIIDNIVAALGPYQSIAPNRSRFTVTFAHGNGMIFLGPADKIEGLIFQPH